MGELAPGNDVFRLIDIALKAATIEATSQIVEREFGFFILRSPVNSEIVAARDAILAHLGISMADRLKPIVESTQIITSVEPYQAQLLNKWRKGSMLVPGQTLGIIECAPAAYVAIAANEAEKAASIDIVEVQGGGTSLADSSCPDRRPKCRPRWTPQWLRLGPLRVDRCDPFGASRHSPWNRRHWRVRFARGVAIGSEETLRQQALPWSPTRHWTRPPGSGSRSSRDRPSSRPCRPRTELPRCVECSTGATPGGWPRIGRGVLTPQPLVGW